MRFAYCRPTACRKRRWSRIFSGDFLHRLLEQFNQSTGRGGQVSVPSITDSDSANPRQSLRSGGGAETDSRQAQCRSSQRTERTGRAAALGRERSQCRGVDTRAARRVRQVRGDQMGEGGEGVGREPRSTRYGLPRNCSPDGARRNPGRNQSRIPLRSIRATLTSTDRQAGTSYFAYNRRSVRTSLMRSMFHNAASSS